jgi:hypothetical protein
MAQAQTRAQKTLHRIGTARGSLASLRQEEPLRVGAILGRYALQYRISVNSMTRAKSGREVTSDDCAAALITNLDQLTVDASYIRGINRVDSDVINSHLYALASECRSFDLAQAVEKPSRVDIDAALHRFLDRGLGSGTFAGSAL